VFHLVGENLFRHTPSGINYALLKRGGKEFRRPLKTTDPRHCDAWLMDRSARTAPSTFPHGLATMKLIFEFAVARGPLVANPARHIARKRIVQPQLQVLTREQFQRRIQAIRDADGSFGTQGKGHDGANLVDLLAYSGCRLREAAGLRWADVDLSSRPMRSSDCPPFSPFLEWAESGPSRANCESNIRERSTTS
jgi:integrase